MPFAIPTLEKNSGGTAKFVNPTDLTVPDKTPIGTPQTFLPRATSGLGAASLVTPVTQPKVDLTVPDIKPTMAAPVTIGTPETDAVGTTAAEKARQMLTAKSTAITNKLIAGGETAAMEASGTAAPGAGATALTTDGQTGLQTASSAISTITPEQYAAIGFSYNPTTKAWEADPRRFMDTYWESPAGQAMWAGIQEQMAGFPKDIAAMRTQDAEALANKYRDWGRNMNEIASSLGISGSGMALMLAGMGNRQYMDELMKGNLDLLVTQAGFKKDGIANALDMIKTQSEQSQDYYSIMMSSFNNLLKINTDVYDTLIGQGINPLEVNAVQNAMVSASAINAMNNISKWIQDGSIAPESVAPMFELLMGAKTTQDVIDAVAKFSTGVDASTVNDPVPLTDAEVTTQIQGLNDVDVIAYTQRDASGNIIAVRPLMQEIILPNGTKTLGIASFEGSKGLQGLIQQAETAGVKITSIDNGDGTVTYQLSTEPLNGEDVSIDAGGNLMYKAKPTTDAQGFPLNPTLNQEYVKDGQAYKWDGLAWTAKPAAKADIPENSGPATVAVWSGIISSDPNQLKTKDSQLSEALISGDPNAISATKTWLNQYQTDRPNSFNAFITSLPAEVQNQITNMYKTDAKATVIMTKDSLGFDAGRVFSNLTPTLLIGNNSGLWSFQGANATRTTATFYNITTGATKTITAPAADGKSWSSLL